MPLSFLGSRRIRIAVIALILILTGVDFYFRCACYIPVWDDVSYEFPLGEHFVSSPDNDYSRKLESLSDVIDSQINHYKYTNGRAIVHTVLQLFALYGTYRWYHLFCPLLLVLTIVLFVRYAAPRHRLNPLFYLLTAVTWLYLYPQEGPFYTPMFGLNYLYPMALVLAFLLTWRHLRSVDFKLSWLRVVGLVLLGIVSGWSHESFAIPLSGVAFFYAVFNYRKLSAGEKVMFVSLWAGTLALFVAPGNFARVEGNPISLPLMVLTGVFMFLSLKLIMSLAIGVILIKVICKRRIRDLIGSNPVNWTFLLMTVIFGLMAHTGVWSYCGIEFAAAILCFNLLDEVVADRASGSMRLPGTVAFTALFILVAVHQTAVIRADIRKADIQRDFIERYVNSADGVVEIPDLKLSPWVKPYIYNWFESMDLMTWWWCIEVGYGQGNPNRLFPLGGKDWMAYDDPAAFFVPENKVTGNSPFYSGEKYYWAKAEELAPAVNYDVNLAPVRFDECPYPLITLKRLIAPGSFWTRDSISSDSVKLVSPLHPRIMAVPKTSWRTVESITAVE